MTSINLSDEEMELLQSLLSRVKESPETEAARSRAESIDSEIYNLAETHEKLQSVVETIIPNTNDGNIVKPIILEWLDAALAAKIGAKMILRDTILRYTDQEIDEAMDQEMMADTPSDWISFYSRRVREDEEISSVSMMPSEVYTETELPSETRKNDSLGWLRGDKFAIALLGLIGGFFTAFLSLALTFR